MKCKHKQKYTEKVEGETKGVIITPTGTIRTGPVNSSMRTYCLKCDVLLEDVEIEDCFTR